MNFKFPKSERLSSETEITNLFGSTQKFTLYPFKVQWEQNNHTVNKLLISCPKRKFKKAVDRNLIKRRMREAYRLNKHTLLEYCQTTNKFYNIAIIFIGNEILDSDVIHKKLSQSLDKLKEELLDHE